MTKKRTAGLSTTTERAHLRRLETAVRNFVAYFEDHPAEFFAPKTRQLADEARAIFTDVDALRAASRKRKQA